MGQVDPTTEKDRPGAPAGAVIPPVMTLFVLTSSDLGAAGQTVTVPATDYALDEVLAGRAEIVDARLSGQELR